MEGGIHMNRDQVITYEPDNSIRKGYRSVFTEIISELKENRWLIYQLFKRDFYATYKQSFIGIFWALIIPLASLATFVILNRSGLFSVGKINVPYPIYAILGLSFWQLFSTGLVASSNSLVKAGSMITQINFSKKSLVIASAGQSIVSFSIQFVFLMALFLYYQFTPNITILLIPVIILPILLLTFGLGLLLSIVNGVIRDVGNVVSLLMTFLMFLTPVLYARPETGILAKITNINPLHYLISGGRNLVLRGTISEPQGFLISSLFSVLIFVLCLIIFHLTETRICERV
jgi:lipopolysaccharide transport system permease protein